MKPFRIILTLLLLVLFIGLLSGCRQDDHGFTGVSSQEFFSRHMHLLEADSAVVIDGRTREMYLGGHLKNAINIDADQEGLTALLREYAKEPLIVVYCTTNRRTGRILKALEGFYEGEVIYINDGIQGWRQNGFPLSMVSESDPESSP